MNQKMKPKLLAVIAMVLISLSCINPAVADEQAETQTPESDVETASLAPVSPMSLSSTPVSYDPYREYLQQAKTGGVNAEWGYTTNLFTGTAVYSYPIEVPKGTNGLQPNLALSFNSQSVKEANFLGNGWSMTENYIQRDIEHTVNDPSDDSYDLHLAGGKQDLVNSRGVWHTEIESFLKIEKGGDSWTIKTKDGTVYYFNHKISSNQNGLTWRWYLSQVTDTHGNNVYYSYLNNPNPSDFGAVYLDKIEYNNGRERKIEFVYESLDRPDKKTRYYQGNKEGHSRRLKEILVKAYGQLVKKYVLDYTLFDVANSVLSKITIYGKDGASSLPPVTFDYYYDKGWASSSAYNPLVYFNKKEGDFYVDSGVRIADVNRDGKIEYLPDDYCPEDFTYDISNEIYGADSGIRFGDVNGDGYIDFLYGNSYYDEEATWLGPRQSIWNPSETWTPPAQFSGLAVVYNPYEYLETYSLDNGCVIVDFNGDGFSDITCGFYRTFGRDIAGNQGL